MTPVEIGIVGLMGKSKRRTARIYSEGFQVTSKSHREVVSSMRKSFRAIRSGAVMLAIATILGGVAQPLAAAERGRQLEFGVEMARRGLWAEALFRFKRAAQEDPDNAKIMNNLAVAHEAVGQFDEALELYRKAVEKEPTNAELKRNYARFVEFYQSFRPRAVEEGQAKEVKAEEESTSEDSDVDTGQGEEADSG
jgi:tetratricopeptide (TPR) repeat protein